MFQGFSDLKEYKATTINYIRIVLKNKAMFGLKQWTCAFPNIDVIVVNYNYLVNVID